MRFRIEMTPCCVQMWHMGLRLRGRSGRSFSLATDSVAEKFHTATSPKQRLVNRFWPLHTLRLWGYHEMMLCKRMSLWLSSACSPPEFNKLNKIECSITECAVLKAQSVKSEVFSSKNKLVLLYFLNRTLAAWSFWCLTWGYLMSSVLFWFHAF